MKLAVVISFVGSFALLAPGGAFAQHSANGAASVGTAVPAGSSSGGGGSSSSSSGGSTSSGGSGDGGHVSSASGRHSSNPNRASNATQSASHTQGVFTNYSQLSGAVPPFSRPRNGASIIGVAVPRAAAPATVGVGGNEGLTFIYGTYNPWIYAYDGIAATAMYGIYDPFDVDFGFPGGVRTVSTLSSSEDGVLRLDVKPWKADVYIDGDRAGSVDQFQGLLHKLRLPAGVHRVELRAPGHETLVVNVRIEPGETITYRGTLEKTAP